MCVCFSLKTNYFEIRFNSLSLKPESSTALGVSVESPPPCQKGIMKCQRGGGSSFHLWAYCLWHPLYYLIILCLGQLTQRTKWPYCHSFIILEDLTFTTSSLILLPCWGHAHSFHSPYYMRCILGACSWGNKDLSTKIWSRGWQTMAHRSNPAHLLLL